MSVLPDKNEEKVAFARSYENAYGRKTFRVRVMWANFWSEIFVENSYEKATQQD